MIEAEGVPTGSRAVWIDAEGVWTGSPSSAEGRDPVRTGSRTVLGPWLWGVGRLIERWEGFVASGEGAVVAVNP